MYRQPGDGMDIDAIKETNLHLKDEVNRLERALEKRTKEIEVRPVLFGGFLTVGGGFLGSLYAILYYIGANPVFAWPSVFMSLALYIFGIIYLVIKWDIH